MKTSSGWEGSDEKGGGGIMTIDIDMRVRKEAKRLSRELRNNEKCESRWGARRVDGRMERK